MTNPNRDLRPEPAGGVRLQAFTRWGMVLAALGLVLVLLVGALKLEPNPKGHGTHMQLGLPPCNFYWVTGVRCPSCGMTTAFAWVVRGRLDNALYANPAGVLLAVTSFVLIPWLILSAAMGRVIGFRSLEAPLIGLVVTVVTVSLLSWMVRLVL